MFVVRLKRPNEDFDFKTFTLREAALARFRTAQKMMVDGDLEGCALFEASTGDADAAVEMVNQGRARLIESGLEDTPVQAPPRTD